MIKNCLPGQLQNQEWMLILCVDMTKTWNGVLWILILETDALILHRRISIFHQEAQIMRDLYAKESCIIIGRLSDYVLHDEPDVLSVFIYAPESFRIDNIMEKTSHFCQGS